MDRTEIIRKLLMTGSDDLVEALYRCLCADRAPCAAVEGGGPRPMTWRAIADWAVTEGALTPQEGRCLWAVGARPRGGPA